MRIALVSPEFPPDIGGVETYAREFVRELAGRGHDLTLFTMRHPEGEADIPGVRIEPTLKLCRDADRKTFANHRTDVWHALNAAYAWLALEYSNTVVTVHGNDFLRPYYPIAQPDLWHIPLLWRHADRLAGILRPLWKARSAALVRHALPHARHIMANSRYTERVLLEKVPGCAGRTSTGLVGVEQRFFGVERRSVGNGPAHLMSVSRLSEPRKNIAEVLRALAMLKDDFAFRYSVVGDGADRPRLEALARELGLEQRVHFAGFVDERQLLDTYAEADLFVLTSSIIPGSHEGFGIVYLEAAASGVPCLAARLAGAVEAVADGVSGFFVDDPTRDSIADALRAFLSGGISFNPQACRDFARNFTWARVVDHALAHYANSAQTASLDARGMR